MIVTRIVLKKYAGELFAPGIAGRWNSEGNKVVYTAGSISLAIMENLVRRKGYGFNHDFAVMYIELPDNIGITAFSSETLPKGWNHPTDHTVGQTIGDAWYTSLKTPVLKVPSAFVPEEYNFVLHSLHPHFSRIKLRDVRGFVPDERLEYVLKA